MDPSASLLEGKPSMLQMLQRTAVSTAGRDREEAQEEAVAVGSPASPSSSWTLLGLDEPNTVAAFAWESKGQAVDKDSHVSPYVTELSVSAYAHLRDRHFLVERDRIVLTPAEAAEMLLSTAEGFPSKAVHVDATTKQLQRVHTIHVDSVDSGALHRCEKAQFLFLFLNLNYSCSTG